MHVTIIIFLAVFFAGFYLAEMLMPSLKPVFERWQKKRMEKMAPKIDGMFLQVSAKKLMLIDTLSPVLGGAAAFILTQNWGIAAGAAGVGLIMPLVIVKQLEAGRRRKFASQLVDGLLILSSSLKAGLSLLQALETLVEEMPAPISQEFSLVIRQMQMGVSLEEAITSLKRRMHLDELDMVITAMLVARETGGDLTVTFSRVINTIQERNKLIGRVNALCIQGKMQGIIMSLLPVGFAAFVYKTNPTFFDVFFKDNFGRMLLGYAFISELLGVFFIRKFSKVDV